MQPENNTIFAEDSNPSITQTLTAYLDGELSEPVREVLDARLAAEPALRALMAELESGKALGLDLFAALAREPVPPGLTRAARITRSAR
ncbi:anti-sigma factor family protein [Rhizobium sp. C4]|uniref:anti-sigma factor family protein n=1 Tax=Rhizobium sp. C4 TaxID=1349800 RepID=UPI001E633EFA|nr:hypothetical protein [Rhizobium sp. C4]MCD2173764.1 hypothetical protein [Rhizobium sp. C4]